MATNHTPSFLPILQHLLTGQACTMVKFYDLIPDSLRDWALEQQIFFTASAPRFGKHVNISPKGLPASTFTVLDPNTACYIDATGSGAETISHIYETNRVTVMFCSFDKSPRIMRFFCIGRVVETDQPEYPLLLQKMGKEDIAGARAVIVLNIFKVREIDGECCHEHLLTSNQGANVVWLRCPFAI